MQVAIVEQGVAPGGGAWLGGQLFSAMVVSIQYLASTVSQSANRIQYCKQSPGGQNILTIFA